MARVQGEHEVDRDVTEFLQEIRVVQTGGQLFFAFLFSVAFAPGFQDLSDAQRAVYGATMVTVAAAIAVLVAPVAVHQWNFGLGMRPQLLASMHWLAGCGLALLGVGMVLGLTLVGSVVFPESPAWLPVSVACVIALTWVVLPFGLRRLHGVRDRRHTTTSAVATDRAADHTDGEAH